MDEVHKYEKLVNSYKNIYDALTLRVVFQVHQYYKFHNKTVIYQEEVLFILLENLSFREYLELCDIYKFDSFSLEDILQNHLAIATEITKISNHLCISKSIFNMVHIHLY